MSGEEWLVNEDQKLENVIKEIRADYDKHKYLRIKLTTGKQRTITQNAAMHKYFELLARELNEAGYTVATTLTKPIEMSWSPSLVKELLWRKIQDALLEKKSTTELHIDECSQIYDELNYIMINKFGVSVPWPSKAA